MKKLATLLVLILFFLPAASAQGKVGIKGGLNFNTYKDLSGDISNVWGKSTGTHFGLFLKTKIPVIGLGFQPELLFVRKGADATDPTDNFYLDYLSLPLNLQLGLDLLLFRPFVIAGPYISYALGKGGALSETSWDDLNRLDFGVGLGAGIDFWKLQITGKYNWALGKLQDVGSIQINGQTLKDAKIDGFQLSIAYIF